MEKNCISLRDTACNPDHARWRHLARSGSQSQRMIQFILPARGGVCHIIKDLIKFHNHTTRVMRIHFMYISTLPDDITCDQASLYFLGGKIRLIQLLDYLSVTSPESGLFSDWSRNKRYLELNH